MLFVHHKVIRRCDLSSVAESIHQISVVGLLPKDPEMKGNPFKAAYSLSHMYSSKYIMIYLPIYFFSKYLTGTKTIRVKTNDN